MREEGQAICAWSRHRRESWPRHRLGGGPGDRWRQPLRSPRRGPPDRSSRPSAGATPTCAPMQRLWTPSGARRFTRDHGATFKSPRTDRHDDRIGGRAQSASRFRGLARTCAQSHRPVGGGGLISGIAIAVKAMRPSGRRSRRRGRIVPRIHGARSAGRVVSIAASRRLPMALAATSNPRTLTWIYRPAPRRSDRNRLEDDGVELRDLLRRSWSRKARTDGRRCRLTKAGRGRRPPLRVVVSACEHGSPA